MWVIEDFQEPTWTNPSDFLNKHKVRFATLNDFALSLNEFAETLKGQLTNIIHEDYTEFVTISKKLVQLGDIMATLIKTLNNAESTVDHASKALQQSFQPLKSRAEKLQKIRRDSAICSLALETIDELQRISKQITDNMDMYVYMDMSISLTVIKTKISVIDQPALNKPISAECYRLENMLKAKVIEEFIKEVKNRDTTNLGIIFGTIVLGNYQEDMHEAFSKMFITPLLDEFMQFSRNKTPNSDRVFKRLIEFIKDESSPLNFVINNSPSIFDFSFCSLWNSINKWLCSRLIFPVGSSSEIMESYNLFNDFLMTIESTFRSQETVKIFRKSYELEEIYKLLSLDVYVQLISIDLLSKAEELLQQDPEETEGEFKLSTTTKYIELIKSVYSPTLFIPEQMSDFTVLAVKLILSLVRYAEIQTKYRARFVVDLYHISDLIIEIAPIEQKEVMELTSSKIKETASAIKESAVSELLKSMSESISSLLRVGSSKDSIKQTLQMYDNWPAGLFLSDGGVTERVIRGVLGEFSGQSRAKIEKMRVNLRNIQAVRGKGAGMQILENINETKKRLLGDVDLLRSYSAEKGVDVTSELSELVEFLTADEEQERDN